MLIGTAIIFGCLTVWFVVVQQQRKEAKGYVPVRVTPRQRHRR